MKYIQVINKKTKTEILIQIVSKNETKYFINSEDSINGIKLIDKIQNDETLINTVLEIGKKIETNEFILLPINFSHSWINDL